jgi:hypothetical protein
MLNHVRTLADLEDRFRQLLLKPETTTYADIHLCFNDLRTLPDSAEAIQFIRRFLTGDLVPGQAVTWWENLLLMNFNAWAMLVNRLFAQHRLTYDTFKRSLLHTPEITDGLERSVRRPYTLEQSVAHGRYAQVGRLIDPACAPVLRVFSAKLAWELMQDFSDSARAVLQKLTGFTDSCYLMFAAQYHAQYLPGRMNLTMVSDSATTHSVGTTLTHILYHLAREDLTGAKRQAVVAHLRSYPASTLQALIPVTAARYDLLCEALNWSHAQALVGFIQRTRLQPFEQTFAEPEDIPNSPDPASGTLDVVEARQALEQAGETLTRMIISLFRQSNVRVNNTLMLLEALIGTNHERVVKGLANHRQIAIKALGLLPLVSHAELMERFLTFRQLARDGQKFGQIRRATHAAAVQAGLNNLAQLAGYSSASRFEWDMEAKIAQEIAPAGRTWTAGEYRIRLKVDGSEARLEVSRNQRRLKNVPDEIRGTEAYQEAKETVHRLRSQVSRLKSGLLEGLVASGDWLTPEELIRLLRLPAAQDMFGRLVMGTEAGLYGLFDVQHFTLVDLDGAAHPITTPVRLAHPYHLYQQNTLTDWQRLMVQRRIVQPVKQVFRELYLLTPAEQDNDTASNRFAGHGVDGATAARLFVTRGWRLDGGNTVIPARVTGGIRAVFDFGGTWHFGGDTTPVTTGHIYFERDQRHPEDKNGHAATRLTLQQVPPLVFSEVMRDADLIVSVAQREGETWLSNESYTRRGSLVMALLADMDVSGVTIDGHFAHVQGKLANYRVHLGSAVIHIEPGNAQIIVPDRWGQKHEKLFLPSADDRDSKLSEVIGKILLLLEDDTITDESLLRQIRQ